MRLTIALPGLIWPEYGDINYIYAQAQTPFLNKLSKYANISYSQFNYSDLLYSGIYNHNNDSLAKILSEKYNLPAKYTTYLIAEPTHLQSDRNRLLISDSSVLQLDDSETQRIINQLNQYFINQAEFFPISTELWLIGLNQDLSDVITYPVNQIIGENIDEYLPAGKNAIRLSQLMTEIQMLLWDYARNNDDYHNEITLNNIWLWDRRIDPTYTAQFEQIFISHTQETINNSILLKNNAKISPIPDHLEHALSHNNLIILDNLYYAACYRDSHSFIKLLNNVDQYLSDLLAQKKYTQLNILLPSKTMTLKLTLNSWSKYKIWRKHNLLEIIKTCF